MPLFLPYTFYDHFVVFEFLRGRILQTEHTAFEPLTSVLDHIRQSLQSTTILI